MISFAIFERAMNALKAFDELENNLSELGIDAFDIRESSELFASYVEVLNESFGLNKNKYYGSELEYYIYDLDFGRNNDSMADGDADFKNLESLYDYLIRIGNNANN